MAILFLPAAPSNKSRSRNCGETSSLTPTTTRSSAHRSTGPCETTIGASDSYGALAPSTASRTTTGSWPSSGLRSTTRSASPTEWPNRTSGSAPKASDTEAGRGVRVGRQLRQARRHLKGETVRASQMACCNLAESFENSASVTVEGSDAISNDQDAGRHLYTRILDENPPHARAIGLRTELHAGHVAQFGFRCRRAFSSVTAGFRRSSARQSRITRKAHRRRTAQNLYLTTSSNLSWNFLLDDRPQTRDKKLTTIVLAHGSMDTKSYDHNHDGFRDLPEARAMHVPTVAPTPPTTDRNRAGVAGQKPPWHAWP